MAKSMIVYIIIVAVVAALVAGYFSYKYMTPSAKIIEYRDFSCPGMTDFTFKYPVFKGFEYILSAEKENLCSIIVRPSNFKMPADPSVRLELALRKIIVTKTPLPKEPLAIPDKVYKNPNGISYAIESQSRLFFASYFYVDIDLTLAPNENSFSRDQFFRTVIESFKLIPVK